MPATVRCLDHPFLDEDVQGATDGVSRDTELPGKSGLRRESTVAGTRPGDLLTERLSHRAVAASAAGAGAPSPGG